MTKFLDTAKKKILKERGTLNPKPDKVTDPLFLEEEFFDPYDLVQVKYEMLRKVEKEGKSVTEAASAYGFSRLSFYRIQDFFKQYGLESLIPKQRGPKEAYKLSEKVMQFVDSEVSKDKTLKARRLKPLIEKKFGITIHTRSIERALNRRKKKG